MNEQREGRGLEGLQENRLQRPVRPADNNAVAIRLVVFSLIGVGLTLFFLMLLSSTGGIEGAGHFLPLVTVFAVIFIPTVLVMSEVRKRAATSKPGAISAAQYDEAIYKKFFDALEAVSIGAGVRPPPLYVNSLSSPQAYLDPVQPGVLLISNELLSAEWTDQEIEVIVAVLLGKNLIGISSEASAPGFYDHKVKEYGLNSTLVGWVRADFMDDRMCLYLLLADAFAARLTGQPQALSRAIKKNQILLDKRKPVVRPRGVWPRFLFVEPPSNIKGNMPGWLFPHPFENTQKVRDRIIELRLENLEQIEAGGRQPYEELRDGRRLTKPEGWE